MLVLFLLILTIDNNLEVLWLQVINYRYIILASAYVTSQAFVLAVCEQNVMTSNGDEF